MKGGEILSYSAHGAQRFKGVFRARLDDVRDALSGLPQDRAGVRIEGARALGPLLAPNGCIGRVAAAVLGAGIRPVRAILFDKTERTNWSLGWHQDRTICVRERREVPGFGPWTVKNGMHHVEPPIDLLARMVTLRVHLDDVSAGNAPLLVAPGSHRCGRIAESEIDETVRQCGTAACLAEAGDVWLYATPILHASRSAAEPARRRVLQVDFAAEALPSGLEWLGI